MVDSQKERLCGTVLSMASYRQSLAKCKGLAKLTPNEMAALRQMSDASLERMFEGMRSDPTYASAILKTTEPFGSA